MQTRHTPEAAVLPLTPIVTEHFNPLTRPPLGRSPPKGRRPVRAQCLAACQLSRRSAQPSLRKGWLHQQRNKHEKKETVNLIPSQNTGVWRLITSILRMEFFTLLKLLGFIVLLANTLKILSKAIQTYTDRMMPKITKMQKYIYNLIVSIWHQVPKSTGENVLSVTVPSRVTGANFPLPCGVGACEDPRWLEAQSADTGI